MLVAGLEEMGGVEKILKEGLAWPGQWREEEFEGAWIGVIFGSQCSCINTYLWNVSLGWNRKHG